MQFVRDWLGVVLLAAATAYAAYLAQGLQEPVSMDQWNRPYLDLIFLDVFSIAGRWVTVAVLALLTLTWAVWILRRRLGSPGPEAVPEAPLAGPLPAVLPQPRDQVPATPVVSPDRIARVVGAWGLPSSMRANSQGDMSPAEQMLADALAEVQRGRGGEAIVPARRRPSLRLVPQVPVREAAAAAWLGGGARLPEGLAWPEIDGEALQLLAQVDCAYLPVDLWGGIGPREGWLAMFLAPRSLKPRVIFFTEAGPFRPSPVMLKDSNMVHPEMWKSESAMRPAAVPALPRWPVEILVVEDGQEEPRRSGRARDIDRFDPLDVAEQRFQPFDWPSLEMMMELALRCSEARLPSDEHLLLNAMSNLEKLKDLRAAVALMAESQPFSPEIASVILIATRLMPAFLPRNPAKPDPQNAAPEAAAGEPTDWQVPYVRFLQDRAKHIHSAGAGTLPAPLLKHCEEVWREWAAHEMGGMGHRPWAKLRNFDPKEEVVLLELPSSHLMNWHFGNAGHLVMTIRRKDLELGDFGRVGVHIRN